MAYLTQDEQGKTERDLYFFAGIFLGRTGPKGAYYPFIDTWALFAVVPVNTSHYTLKIHSLDGQNFDPPRPLETMPEYSNRRNWYNIKRLVINMGKAKEAGDEALSEQYRQTLEANYMWNSCVSYTLVKHRYQPLERWETGEYQETELGDYQKAYYQRSEAKGGC